METVFSTNECPFSHVSISILNRKITGLRGFEILKEVEKEHLYASGDEPVDIQSGNKKYSGNLKVLKYEVDLWNEAARAAGYQDITEVPHQLIAADVQYRKNETAPIKRISVPGISFTNLGVAMEQNAKMTEVTLNFLAMRIIHS